MNNAQKEKLEKLLNGYFGEIHRLFLAGGFTEASFYPCLQSLMSECSKLFHLQNGARVLVQPKKTEVGIPDFVIKTDLDIIGYIEVKLLDANLDEVENTNQLTRYRDSLPNLILTNLIEFRLFRNGKPLDAVEVSFKSPFLQLASRPMPRNVEQFGELLDKFFQFSVPQVKTSAALCAELARRTKLLKDVLYDELSRDNEEVTRFYKAFQQELIETLGKERFADLYAQTITYGMFAARLGSHDSFGKDTAWRLIPESLPLLREIFYSFTGPHFPESLDWVVEDIIHVLRKADISAINKEFKTTRWEEDPVINFYETFLATYNPKERERLGVYYTPLPVVSYIVRSVHKLLKSKFDKAEGLATNDVTLLDPAAGTLTFVVQAIKQVQKELEERNKAGLLRAYIESHILRNFHAFEILVSPYTVGHLKLAMVLEEMGYRFKRGEHFKFYLTNALEMKEPNQTSFLIDLTKEAQEAKRVKEAVPILVVLGNPPYSGSSENKSEFIEHLMDTYKEDVREEKNLQPLSNDYIKFIRFGHWKIEQAGRGILGFITSNSYLSGMVHRGMRRRLLESFDEIYILNLHGSSRIGEKTPEGGKDENVFDIQQGVAISIYVKKPKPAKQKKVFYADVWGSRREKYRYLATSDVELTRWQKVTPKKPFYFFVPKNFALLDRYQKFWSLTDIFRQWSSAVKTHRDHLVVGFTKRELVQKLRTFTGPLPDDVVAQTLGLKETSTWKLAEARKEARTRELESKIFPYAYRAFDKRWVCYDPSLIDRGRWGFMNRLIGDGLCLAVTRILAKCPFRHAFVTDSLADICLVSTKTKETAYLFPLHAVFEPRNYALFEDQDACVPNSSSKFTEALKGALDVLPPVEEVFYYIYSVLYSPTYRHRYAEFLKIDFARIPLPTSYEAFRTLSDLGKELVELHLLKHPALAQAEVGYPSEGSDKVDFVRFNESAKKVFINKQQYFEGVSKEVWEYRIGAYQVMEKYLKDRKGRKLLPDEINHYTKMARAIGLTIELQQKIDNAYPKVDP